MKKVLTILTLALLFAFSTSAQMKMGAPAGAPDASAILDLSNTTGTPKKGFLGPQVALTGTADATTIASPATSLMVYNTATAGSGASAVTPGYYYFNATQWVKMVASSSAVAGGNIYSNDGTLTSARTVAMGGNNLGFTGGGGVGIGTAAPNGAFHVVTEGSGGPVALIDRNSNGGWNVFSMRKSTGTLAVPTAVPIGLFSQIQFSPYGVGNYNQGTSINSYATEIQTASNGGASLRFLTTPNGTNISAERMTIDQNGNVGIGISSPQTSAILDLTNNGTRALLLPNAANTAAIATPVNGMLIYDQSSNSIKAYQNGAWSGLVASSSTDAIRTAIVAGGVSADLTAYDNATTNTVIKVAVNTYNAVQAVTGALTLLNDNNYMATNPPNGGISGSNFTVGTPATVFVGTYFTAGQYIMAFQLKNKGFGTGASDLGGIIKFASSATGPYTDYCGAMPAFTLTANYTPRYYVIKTPGNAVPASPQMAVYASSNWSGDHVGAGSTSNMPVPYASGNTNTLTANGSSIYNSLYIQAIVLPTKKW